MWYTHYNDADVTNNRVVSLYRKLLWIIKSVSGKSNLLTLRDNCITKSRSEYEEEFDENFHEIFKDKGGDPILYKNFTKTARKRYDPAVLLSYMAAAILDSKEPSWDYSEKSIQMLWRWLNNQCAQTAANWLLYYIEQESICIQELKDDDLDKRAWDMCNNTIEFINNSCHDDDDDDESFKEVRCPYCWQLFNC